MGVTTHSPLDLEFPFTMTNVRSGTWMMTGNGVCSDLFIFIYFLNKNFSGDA